MLQNQAQLLVPNIQRICVTSPFPPFAVLGRLATPLLQWVFFLLLIFPSLIQETISDCGAISHLNNWFVLGSGSLCSL